MSLHRHAARRDENEQAMRDELADCGWLTQPLSLEDWPDLMCAKGGRLKLLEVKSEAEYASRAHGLSTGQLACHAMLALFGIEVIVACTAEQFLRAVGDLH